MKLVIMTVLFVLVSATAQAETIKVTVNGLVCSFCATGIEKTFRKQEAVEEVKVDLDQKLVLIQTKEQSVLDDETVTKLVKDAGYSVTDIKRE
jgi:copper chaperone CopZ